MKKLTVKDLTNEEKARLVIGKNVWHNEDLEGRVPVFMMSDGPVGVRHPRDLNSAVTDTAPSIACLLQERLGLNNNVFAFDLNGACSGFVYALSVARSLLYTSDKRYALIIGAEQLSNLIDWKDRTTCILFGDGAGAVVVEKEKKLFCDYQGSEGNEEVLYGLKNDYLHMEGKEVFKFATRVLPMCIEKVLEKASLTKDDIDYFVVHQANERIIRHVYKKMKITSDKFYLNVDEYGNTSAASIPLVLGEMNEKKLLKRGMKILCVGFGAGLTYGANLIEW